MADEMVGVTHIEIEGRELEELIMDWEELRFSAQHREGVRDGVEELIEQGRYEEIFATSGMGGITRQEARLLIQKVEVDPNDPKIEETVRMMAIFRSGGGDIERLIKERVPYYKQDNYQYQYEQRDRARGIMRADNSQEAFSSSYEKMSEWEQKRFLNAMNMRLRLVVEELQTRENVEWQPRAKWINKEFGGREVEIEEIKEKLTENLEDWLENSQVKQAAVAALIKVNPGRVMDLIDQGKVGKEWLLIMVKVEPDEVYQGIERGILEQEDVLPLLAGGGIGGLKLLAMMDNKEEVIKEILYQNIDGTSLDELVSGLEGKQHLLEFLGRNQDVVVVLLQRKLDQELEGLTIEERTVKLLHYKYSKVLRLGEVMERVTFEMTREMVGTRLADDIEEIVSEGRDKYVEQYGSELGMGYDLAGDLDKYLDDLGKKHEWIREESLQVLAAEVVMSWVTGDGQLEILENLDIEAMNKVEKAILLNSVLRLEPGYYSVSMASRLFDLGLDTERREVLIGLFGRELQRLGHNLETGKEVVENGYYLGEIRNLARGIGMLGDVEMANRLVEMVVSHNLVNEVSLFEDGEMGLKEFARMINPENQLSIVMAANGDVLLTCLFELDLGGNREKVKLFKEIREKDEHLGAFQSYDEFQTLMRFNLGDYLYNVERLRVVIEIWRRVGSDEFRKMAANGENLMDDRRVLERLDFFVAADKLVPGIVRGTIFEYRGLFLGEELKDNEIEELELLWRKIESNPDRMMIDLQRLIGDKKRETEVAINKLFEGKKMSDEERFVAEKWAKRYLLIRWNSMRTGMTTEQTVKLIIETSEFVNKKRGGSRLEITVDGLLQTGVLGNKLLLLGRFREPFFAALRDSLVSSEVNLLEILQTDDLQVTIEMIVRNASYLSGSKPEWERLTDMALNQVLKKENKIFWEGERRELTEDLAERVKLEMEQALERVWKVDRKMKEAASRRNMEIAEALRREGADYNLEKGVLIHTTGYGVVPAVIKTANLAGECLGTINARSDNYPGYCDLQLLDERWGDLGVASVFNSNGRYKTFSGAMLVYGKEVGERAIDVGGDSRHLGHKLVFGGVASIGLRIIVIDKTGFKEEAEFLALVSEYKESMVTAGIYVPVLSVDSELLVTPEEYKEAYRNFKTIANLEELIQTDKPFDDRVRQTMNSSGIQTLAEHMDIVVGHIETMVEKMGIDEDTARIVLAAGKLHDVGKGLGLQELANVQEAARVLDRVEDLNLEDRRRVLLLIKYDELFGEILKNVVIEGEGVRVGSQAKKKIKQLEDAFTDEQLFLGLLLLYQADILGVGRQVVDEWEVKEKLSRMGYPVYID